MTLFKSMQDIYDQKRFMDKNRQKHIQNFVILVVITIIIGVYFIATTKVVCDDGIVYIERAQKLSVDPRSMINAQQPVGFPALILGFHHILAPNDLPHSWILSAQIAVLTCRVLSIAVLYLFGTILFDRKQAFWGVLILIFLPKLAQHGSDVLRDWPHFLFLFSSLLLLYQGIRKTSWIYLFGAGVICGLGHIIRPECAQVVLYGFAFLVIKLFSAWRRKVSLRPNWIYVCLFAGFLSVFVPYMAQKDEILPRKFKYFNQKTSQNDMADKVRISTEQEEKTVQTDTFYEKQNIFHAVGALFNGMAENFKYYFFLPAAIGFYLLFLKSIRQLDDKHLLIGMIGGFYVITLCMLDMGWGYIASRHLLILTALLCFYIPEGMRWIICKLNSKRPLSEASFQKWTMILVGFGFLICLPRLIRPIEYEKKEYLDVIEWISHNTEPSESFYSFDPQIPFYANRRKCIYSHPTSKPPAGYTEKDYLIAESNHGQLEISIPEHFELLKTFPMDYKNKAILVYKRISNKSNQIN